MGIVKLTEKFAKLKSNKIFEIFVIGVIIFSALVVGAKTYPIPNNLFFLVTLFDWLITLFFLFEISIRFVAEEHKKRFFHNFWNTFDSLIVAISLIPIEDSEIAIIGRLIRIFRVLRMVSVIPELRVLIGSLARALPKLGYVILLMFIIFYIYAAIGATLFAPINTSLWGDISIAMLTLFRVMTFEDWTDVMYETMAVYPLSWFYYLSFIFFTAFAFLNMVIGIVVGSLEEENTRIRRDEQGEPSLQELQADIHELKKLVQKLSN